MLYPKRMPFSLFQRIVIFNLKGGYVGMCSVFLIVNIMLPQLKREREIA